VNVLPFFDESNYSFCAVYDPSLVVAACHARTHDFPAICIANFLPPTTILSNPHHFHSILAIFVSIILMPKEVFLNEYDQ
jgi:hypothetical protein